jgi:hypothetical protein
MQKKSLLMISFTLAVVIVLGPMAFSIDANENGNGMMGDGGMMMGENNSMNSMMKMMDNENMGKMMNAMATPEGEKMMKSCGNFMSSYSEQEEDNQES